MESRPFALLTTLVLAAGSAGGVSAQNWSPTMARINFNFSPPGARATALGGAFIPLADDATAAESNPAGLTVLLRPEIAFEGRAINSKVNVPAFLGGTSSSNTSILPSFISAAFPHKSFTFAAYIDQNAIRATPTGITTDHSFSFAGDLDLTVANFGVAAALKPASGLSVGLAAGMSRLSLSNNEDYTSAFQGQTDNFHYSIGSGSQTAPFANIGFKYDVGNSVSLGAVYKARAKFKGLQEVGTENGSSFTNNFGFNTPDSYGGGIAIRPSSAVTIIADAEVTLYSQLADAMNAYFTDNGDPGSATMAAKDGTDIRLGAEYVSPTNPRHFALRAGIARVAASNIFDPQFGGTDEFFSDKADDPTMRFSLGGGILLSPRTQLDLAGSFGKLRTDVALSLVYRLGKD